MRIRRNTEERYPLTITQNTFRPNSISRVGGVFVVVAFLLPAMTVLAAFCINSAQMQLARTELMVATDAAAKAGGRAFSELQSTNEAKRAARVTAARNFVQGEKLRLRFSNAANEIEFGRTEQPGGEFSRYDFIKIPTDDVEQEIALANAVRVTGKRDAYSRTGKVPLFLPGILNSNDFSIRQDAIAMQVDRDIALVLDRSGSMSEVFFDWPRGQSPWYQSVLRTAVSQGLLILHRGNYYYAKGVTPTSYQQWAWQSYYHNGPAPTSPWEDLVTAVHAFLEVLEKTCQAEQVAIASYASKASLDSNLTKKYQSTRDCIAKLFPTGMTAIGEGMFRGYEALDGTSSRPYAAKTMVVMTDGIHNTGISPDKVARELIEVGDLIIHTITFGESADQSLMQTVASIGGGNHYHASDASELVMAFQEIANNLPTILVE